MKNKMKTRILVMKNQNNNNKRVIQIIIKVNQILEIKIVKNDKKLDFLY